MTGRKDPEPTEQEREHEYVMRQKRSHGDTVVGDEAADIDDTGPAAEVARERERYAENKERLSRQDF